MKNTINELHEQRLLTIPQAARRLNCTPITVFRKVWSNEIPSVLLSPRMRRIKADDLQAYIESKYRAAPRNAKSTLRGNE